MRTMDIWYAHLSEDDADDARCDTPRPALARQGAAAQRRRRRARGTGAREDRREGAHPRQPAGAVQARRARRRPVPDRQPAADRRPGRATGRTLRPVRRRGRARDPRAVPRLPGAPCRTTAGTCSSGSSSSTSPARWSASAASGPGRSSCCSRAATTQDPLFLQVKEATASVLEDHLPKSRYRQPGERVVQGQRMMQAASDIFLGWTKGVRGEPLPLLAAAARHEGLRVVEAMIADGARRSTPASAAGPWPGRTPGPATRSRIAAYLGKKDAFDQSITDFAERYADQNERDYASVHRRDPRPAGSKRSRASENDAGQQARTRSGGRLVQQPCPARLAARLPAVVAGQWTSSPG